MKKIVVLIFVFILYVVTADVALAKRAKGLDENQPSVQYLRMLTEQGEIVRRNDEPVLKADVEADTVEVRVRKQKYNEENAFLLQLGKKKKFQENPD